MLHLYLFICNLNRFTTIDLFQL